MHWDFAAILAFLAIAVPLLGRHRIRRLIQLPQTSKTERLTLYASTIAFQWLMVAVILWRTTAHHVASSSLALAVPNPGFVLLVSFILTSLVLANQMFSLRQLPRLPRESQGILPHLALKVFPQDGLERAAFFAVVVTVSLCEELIFRGFAQHIFEDSVRGSVAAGILGSSFLFAIAHLYQGRKGLSATFVVAVLFAATRSWTGSLVPPVIAHFSADVTAGFLAPSRFRAAPMPSMHK